jgi:beta-lactamase class A
LVAENPKLQPGVFIVDLDTGAYIDFNSRSTLAAASTIKLPILVALFQDVDAGKIRLDETLTLQQEMIAAGSGNLQYQKPGTKFTVLDLATKMMVISDNTATNVLIARLGGTEVLSQRFRSWGLTTTVLNNVLPDLEGTNTTSPQELGMLMSMVNQGQLVSLRSRDRILGIMQQNQISTLLPKGLGEGAIIAHKTGNIGEMLADAGLVDMPSGKRYIITVMVKRPFNDPGAENLIHKISQLAYEHFNQPLASPNTTLLPSGRIPSTSSRAIAWNPFY